MLVGIDVGGTFTDGVLYQKGKILKNVKKATKTDLQASVLAVLDELLQRGRAGKIARLVLSTTLVTNILATGRGDPVALVLIPGPGLIYEGLGVLPQAFYLKGAVDFRGRIIEDVDQREVECLARSLVASGLGRAAVVGKFSQRNDALERKVSQILQRQCPDLQILRGFEVSGQLNFPRRAITTYYTAQTGPAWARFARQIERAIRARGVGAPIEILKADGGTMPLAASFRHPIETVFSGPAASVMGAYALTMDEEASIVVDMGGTTTDLALILDGQPLYASKGALIDGYYSHVRSFATRVLALGGDSQVTWQEGQGLSIGPRRRGPAACFGGPAPTPTDAINLLEKGKLGGLVLSEAALQDLADQADLNVRVLAEMIVAHVVHKLQENIKAMFWAWKQEPAYKIWELLHQSKVQPGRVVGIGAAAGAFVPRLAQKMGCQALLHSYGPVANALGATVARPTLSLLLHADTEKGVYYLDQEGISGACQAGLKLEDAKELALQELQEQARLRGIEDYADRYEFFLEEQFNMIRGWSTVGKLYDVGIQIVPGVVDDFQGVQM